MGAEHTDEQYDGATYVVFGARELGGANDAPRAADDTLVLVSSQVIDLAADNGAGADHDLDNMTITMINGVSVTIGDSVLLAPGLRASYLGGTEVMIDAPGTAVGTHLDASFTYEISDSGGESDTANVSVEFVQAAIDLADLDGAHGFRLGGTDPYSEAGFSVAGAGDLNGDGFGDVLISAPGEFDSGASYVVFGSSADFAADVDLTTLDGSDGFRLDGIAGAAWKLKVAGAGDTNGDGFNDLIIGAYTAAASYVVFGSAAGFPASIDLNTLDGSDGFRLSGPDYSASGYAVAGAGDINGDGVDDLIIGAPGEGYARYAGGSSYVLFGSIGGRDAIVDLTTLDGTSGFRLDGGDYAYSANSVAGAGDINGDGLDDLVVSGLGGAVVVYGSEAAFAPSRSLAEIGGTDGFQIVGGGGDVSGIGDVNGDGVDDLIVGAGGANGAGASYVIFGSTGGLGPNLDLETLDGTNGFRLDGIDAYDFAGWSVAGAGDFNGDALDDIVIWASGGDPEGRSDAGEAYVIFGSSEGFATSVDLAALDGVTGIRIDGIHSAGGLIGGAVAGAGDVNGDSLDDVIVGAPYADPGGTSDAGESYVVYGFRTAAPCMTTASIAAGWNDAEQRGGHMRLASEDLDIRSHCQQVGLRFTRLAIPDGATITSAHIEFEALGNSEYTADITIALEDTTKAARFGSGENSIASRDHLDEITDWSPGSWETGETYATADLAATIASLVGSEGLETCDALMFRFSGTGERTAWSFEGEAPRLVIEYEDAATAEAPSDDEEFSLSATELAPENSLLAAATPWSDGGLL